MYVHNRRYALCAPGCPAEQRLIPLWEWSFGTWRVSVERTPLTAGGLVRLYDRVASTWDRRMRWLRFGSAYRLLLRQLIASGPLGALPPDARVLDAGAGTGILSLTLASESTKRLRIEALDLSPRMVRAADASFRAAGIGADVAQGDLRRLPYEDEVFDLVIAAHVLEHLSDAAAALRELVRVLRPGGSLLLLVTRRSLLGAVVQLRWPVRALGEEEVTEWLHAVGVTEVRFSPIPGPFWCRRMSLACMGHKAKRIPPSTGGGGKI